MSFENGVVTAKEIADEQKAKKAEVVTENENKRTNDVPVSIDVTANSTVNGQLPDYAILNPDLPMSAKIDVASNVATCLKDLIESQGLVKRGLNKQNPKEPYVLVEGWEVLGTMLGIVPVTEIINTQTNKQGRVIGYDARASLYRNPIIKNGEIVGGELISRTEASADKSGFQNDLPSIKSMAQTRALGKCYRMALSWIVKMAGYNGTPAEEMESFEGK